MEITTAVIQIAHGFTRAPRHAHDYGALSRVDLDRSITARYAIERFRLYFSNLFVYNDFILDKTIEKKIEIWTTGQVSLGSVAEVSSRTLATMNAKRLMEYYPRTNGDYCYREVPGIDAFSESWNASTMLEDAKINYCIIVASDFYLTAYADLWKAVALRTGVELFFKTAFHEPGTVPLDVLKHHLSPQTQFLSRLAVSSPMGHKLAIDFHESLECEQHPKAEVGRYVTAL